MKNRIQQPTTPNNNNNNNKKIPSATTKTSTSTCFRTSLTSANASSRDESAVVASSLVDADDKDPPPIPSSLGAAAAAAADNNNNNNNIVHVAVIGGGFAGLAAARTLLQQPTPCHVTVLEAKSRWGGRLHSVCLDDNDTNENVFADLGGMFWHGNTAVYQTLARDFPHVESILTDGDSKIPAAESAMWLRHANDDSTTTTTTRPQPVTTQEIRRSQELYCAWETAMHQRYNQQVQQCNKNHSFQNLNEAQTCALLAQWNDDFCQTLSETDYNLLQLRLTMSFEMDRGMSWEKHTLAGLDQDWDWVDAVGDDVIARHGMQEWVNAVVQDIRCRGGRLMLNQRVDRIEHGTTTAGTTTGGCTIVTEQGRVFRADHVVVALPLGVLKEKAGQLFSPPLPALKMDALDRAGVGVLNTLLVRWNRPLALPGLSNAYYFMQSKHKGNPLRHGFCCPSHLRQSRSDNTITQFHFSETNHPFDDLEYWKAQALQVVQDVVQEPLSVQDILVAHVSQWHLDPEIRGAYSAATTRTRGNADRMLLGMSVGRRVFFAGEHTHTGGRYQSLDGAYETGVRAAQEILHVLAENATTVVTTNTTTTTLETPLNALVTTGRA